MKLHTEIPVRRDGTVKAALPGGRTITFTPDADGHLAANVEDVTDVAFLLDTGAFYPADEVDFAAALKVVAPPAVAGNNQAQEPGTEPETPPPPAGKPGRKKRGA